MSWTPKRVLYIVHVRCNASEFAWLVTVHLRNIPVQDTLTAIIKAGAARESNMSKRERSRFLNIGQRVYKNGCSCPQRTVLNERVCVPVCVCVSALLEQNTMLNPRLSNWLLQVIEISKVLKITQFLIKSSISDHWDVTVGRDIECNGRNRN